MKKELIANELLRTFDKIDEIINRTSDNEGFEEFIEYHTIEELKDLLVTENRILGGLKTIQKSTHTLGELQKFYFSQIEETI